MLKYMKQKIQKKRKYIRRKTVIKRFFCTLCAILLIVMCLPALASCSAATVYELGPYSINEEEYAYLMCTHKRQILETIGLDETYINTQISAESTTTYGEYIETMYRQQFEQSVYSLLYAQALFDEYGLTLTDEEMESVNAVANAMIYNYAGGSKSKFDQVVEDYGFTHETLFSIYEKQAKESKVVGHIFGDNYKNLTDNQKEYYYSENYIHFQTIVVNCLYQKNADGTFSNLSEEERATKLKLVDELARFLCSEEINGKYELLPKILKVDDMSKVTYEDIYNNTYINDDLTYPGGMYMVKPNAAQSQSKTVLTQAMLTLEGDVSAIEAKRYFEGEGSITVGGSSEAINKGDYFEYGKAFIKRLSVDEGAWKKEENKDFFSGDDFISGVARTILFETYADYEQKSPYTLMVNTSVQEEYSLTTMQPNRMDYDYFHQTEENK